MTILRTLLVLLVLAATAACATSTQLYSPGPSTLGAEPVTDFDRYVESVKAYVDTNLVPVYGFEREQQVQWNLPYRLAPAAGCSDKSDSLMILPERRWRRGESRLRPRRWLMRRASGN